MTSYVETDEHLEYVQFAFKSVYVRVSLWKAESYLLSFLRKVGIFVHDVRLCLCVLQSVCRPPLVTF